ncbi:MAG: Rdx family protein [Pirellulaceae bacterium]|nr:Rdx family protein [Pirellulaceae bacterium]
MAARILTQYKQQLAGLELEPAAGGCFELSVDGRLIYSKLETGEFPDEERMVAEVGRRLSSRSLVEARRANEGEM